MCLSFVAFRMTKRPRTEQDSKDSEVDAKDPSQWMRCAECFFHFGVDQAGNARKSSTCCSSLSARRKPPANYWLGEPEVTKLLQEEKVQVLFCGEPLILQLEKLPGDGYILETRCRATTARPEGKSVTMGCAGSLFLALEFDVRIWRNELLGIR